MRYKIPWLIALLLVSVVMAGQPRLPKDTLPATINITTIPLGLDPQRPVPAENVLTDAKVKLGRRLFFDPILSGNRTVSCASCHQPKHGFASPEPLAVGIGGKRGVRNAPSLFNVAYGTSFFWDGRARTLEEQALLPINNPRELGSSHAEVVKRLRADHTYVAEFKAAFQSSVSIDLVAKALASFERTLLLGDSPVDRFHAGDASALATNERQGMWIFDSRGRCWRCHSGPNLSDGMFHNTGVSWGKDKAEVGRYRVTKRQQDRGAFKTPTLRGVAKTAPYMHNGSMKTLTEVVEFYNRGGVRNPHLDANMQPLRLSKEDVRNLVAFLKALSR